MFSKGLLTRVNPEAKENSESIIVLFTKETVETGVIVLS